MKNEKLLKPIEVDILFRYPNGRTMRLIRQGKIEAVLLPDGEYRVKQETVNAILAAKGGNNE